MSQTDYAAIIELPYHKLRDRWPITADGTGGIAFGPIQQKLGDDSLVDMAIPLARVVITFRKQSGAGKPFIIDSDINNPDRNAPVEITDAESWEFRIPVIQQFLPSSGIWNFDCAVYISGSASPQTIYRGSLTVEADV